MGLMLEFKLIRHASKFPYEISIAACINSNKYALANGKYACERQDAISALHKGNMEHCSAALPTFFDSGIENSSVKVFSNTSLESLTASVLIMQSLKLDFAFHVGHWPKINFPRQSTYEESFLSMYLFVVSTLITGGTLSRISALLSEV